MKKNWLIKNILIITISMIIFCVVSIFLTNHFVRQQQEESIKQFTNYAKTTLVTDDNYQDYFNKLDTTYRVTIVKSNGEVVYDSFFDINELDNHSDRDEIKNLGKFYVRNSESGDQKMLYYAQPTANNIDVIIRIAAPLNTINSYLGLFIGLSVLVTVVLIAISLLYSYKTNRNVYNTLSDVYSSLSNLSKGVFYRIEPVGEYSDMFVELNNVGEIVSDNFNTLQNQKLKLENIIDSLEYGVIIIDKNLDIESINSKCKNILQLGDSDFVGKKIFSLNLNESMMDLIHQCVSKDVGAFAEVEHNARTYIVSVGITQDNYIVLLSDVTESKQYSKMRSEFFENASHELKTPVTSIVGFSQLVKETNDQELQSKYIEKIAVHSDRLLNLVSDMIELNKLDHFDSLDSDLEIVDVEACANNVLQKLDYMLSKHKVSAEVVGQGQIYGTVKSVEEILENLVSNAIKYNKKNGAVTIKIDNKPDGVVIFVSDTGIGIPQEDIPRIFERFYRVDKSRSKLTGGTGLGLSIVKHLVSKYNGTIDVASEVNSGTEFRLQLFDIT